ncbi:homoserine O-acetyltransferase/O-succinyltransferase family protein [Acidiphilium sp.]|uniref:homoserine O-acetyltransferase/O-succinyltransferase family protein n=1 Tax=Acidiphilium sp. TaxID=527 RepID=UPI003D062BB3
MPDIQTARPLPPRPLVATARPIARQTASRPLSIGLINNMRGSGFRDSDRQFRAMIAAASPLAAIVTGYSIADPPSAEAGRDYRALAALDEASPDGLIITGAEPAADALHQEAFYPALTRVIDRAIDRRIPVVFSCLATHVAVLHLSGIARRRLPQKCHGVLSFALRAEHAMTRGMRGRIRVPHSRWNTLDEAALTASGYRVLTASARAGVDRFVHQDAPGCVFLQGHPEYEPLSLPGEYRRDVRRYLCGETHRYPTIPSGCFDTATRAALRAFRRQAKRDRDPAMMAALPLHAADPPDARPWQDDAVQFYRNWLSHVAASAGIPCAHDV